MPSWGLFAGREVIHHSLMVRNRVVLMVRNRVVCTFRPVKCGEQKHVYTTVVCRNGIYKPKCIVTLGPKRLMLCFFDMIPWLKQPA